MYHFNATIYRERAKIRRWGISKTPKGNFLHVALGRHSWYFKLRPVFSIKMYIDSIGNFPGLTGYLDTVTSLHQTRVFK